MKIEHHRSIVCISLFGSKVAALLRSKKPRLSENIIEINDQEGLASLDSIHQSSVCNVVVRLYDATDYPYPDVRETLLEQVIERILSKGCRISAIHAGMTYSVEGRIAGSIAKEKLALCEGYCSDIRNVGGDETVENRFGKGDHNLGDVINRDAEDVCNLMASLN